MCFGTLFAGFDHSSSCRRTDGDRAQDLKQ